MAGGYLWILPVMNGIGQRLRKGYDVCFIVNAPNLAVMSRAVVVYGTGRTRAGVVFSHSTFFILAITYGFRMYDRIQRLLRLPSDVAWSFLKSLSTQYPRVLRGTLQIVTT